MKRKECFQFSKGHYTYFTDLIGTKFDLETEKKENLLLFGFFLILEAKFICYIQKENSGKYFPLELKLVYTLWSEGKGRKEPQAEHWLWHPTRGRTISAPIVEPERAGEPMLRLSLYFARSIAPCVAMDRTRRF